jgi:hypothetical protein
LFQRCDQGCVHLQKRFTASQDDHTIVWRRGLPCCQRCIRQAVGRGKTLTTNEIGVTKLTDGFGTIFLPPRPEVASGEADKDGDTSDVGTFALDRQEQFLDNVTQR